MFHRYDHWDKLVKVKDASVHTLDHGGFKKTTNETIILESRLYPVTTTIGNGCGVKFVIHTTAIAMSLSRIKASTPWTTMMADGPLAPFH